jgi:hypothetical protein
LKTNRVVVWGGCHVVGYPLGPAHSFTTKLCELGETDVVGQVANLSFLRMPNQLATLRELQPTHIVLQLGNYEFSASFSHVWRLFIKAFNQKSDKGKPASSDSNSNRSVDKSADATAANQESGNGKPTSIGNSSDRAVDKSIDAPPARTKLEYYSRVGGLSLLTVLTWLLSSRYRRAFQHLNECVMQYPGTAFFVLSPLPCLDPAANTVRRLGGWLLRNGLHNQPNLHWLNTHEVIATDPRFFADLSHLNDAGHYALALRLDNAFRVLAPAYH